MTIIDRLTLTPSQRDLKIFINYVHNRYPKLKLSSSASFEDAISHLGLTLQRHILQRLSSLKLVQSLPCEIAAADNNNR